MVSWFCFTWLFIWTYFVWIISFELLECWWIIRLSLGAEGSKTTDLGCCVQRQSCDVRKGCQWPQTCFFFKPLLCVGTKQLLRGTPLGFACHTKSYRWRITQLQYTHNDAGTQYASILIPRFFHTSKAFREYQQHRATNHSVTWNFHLSSNQRCDAKRRVRNRRDKYRILWVTEYRS